MNFAVKIFKATLSQFARFVDKELFLQIRNFRLRCNSVNSA